MPPTTPVVNNCKPIQREGNEEGGNFFFEHVQCNAQGHCATIFIYSYSSSHNIQLLTIEVSSYATEK
jgi:hypothetical protein